MKKIFEGCESLFNEKFLVMETNDDFWLTAGVKIEEMSIIQISKATAQQVAIVILKQLGHQIIVLDDYDENGGLR